MKQIANLRVLIVFKEEGVNDQTHLVVRGWLNEEGYLHRENGPAYISVLDNQVRSKQWFINALLIRVE